MCSDSHPIPNQVEQNEFLLLRDLYSQKFQHWCICAKENTRNILPYTEKPGLLLCIKLPETWLFGEEGAAN